jgi:GDP-L-fucose synthase
LMNVDRLKSLNWEYKMKLTEGLTLSYEWFLGNQDKFRG